MSTTGLTDGDDPPNPDRAGGVRPDHPLCSAAMRRWHPFLVAALFLAPLGLGVGCAPEIGDACETSVDCSVNGERICDIASNNGYCTVQNCEEGTCPEDSVCVEYRFMPERLATSWCMAPCEGNDDCRTDEGYGCIAASDITDEDGEVIARVLDQDRSQRFCSYTGE